MHRTVSQGHAGASSEERVRAKRSSWRTALLVGAAIVGVPATAYAGMAVTDATAISVLQQILAEMKAQTQVMEQQASSLEEIKALDEEILKAICPSSTVTMVGANQFDGDGFNIAATPLSLIGQDAAELGYTVPSPNDVKGLQRAMRNMLGVAAEFEDLADNPNPERVGRMGLELVKHVQRSRAKAQADAVRKSLAYSAYSLNEGQSAKTREDTLDQGRRSAGCLREDVTASHETLLELLQRMNHLITLQANASAVDAMGEVRKMPVKAVPPAGEWKDPDQ